MDDSSNNDVFIYTEGAVVPNDVVRVRVHPSVTVIPEEAFYRRQNLVEVELCYGLLEIRSRAFMQCDGLRNINIPTTVKRIEMQAFAGGVQLLQIRLPDGIEYIGRYAFACGIITNFRVPPMIVSTPNGMFSVCAGMFSVEVSESVTTIASLSFRSCKSLRNIALPQDAETSTDEVVEDEDRGVLSNNNSFSYCRDLEKLFGSATKIDYILKHRFDNLPIHKMIYYQSFNNVTSEQLNNDTDIGISLRRSKLNSTGSRQDSLGMTPLHIMACSTVQDISLYRVLVNKYPETLVTEDRWGALPLLYAVWGQAPDEIVQFLVESYKSIYPVYELNWTGMLRSLGMVEALDTESNGLENIIQNLLDLQQESFSDQLINWEEVLNLGNGRICPTTFGFLIKCSIEERVNAIGLKQYRDTIMKKVNCMTENRLGSYLSRDERKEIQSKVQPMLVQYETEYQSLKEATSMLELVLWKNTINKAKSSDDRRGTKEEEVDEPRRNQCRINCGANIIIRNVLPYLLPS